MGAIIYHLLQSYRCPTYLVYFNLSYIIYCSLRLCNSSHVHTSLRYHSPAIVLRVLCVYIFVLPHSCMAWRILSLPLQSSLSCDWLYCCCLCRPFCIFYLVIVYQQEAGNRIQHVYWTINEKSLCSCPPLP